MNMYHRVETRKYADELEFIDPEKREWHVGDEYAMVYNQNGLNIIQKPVKQYSSGYRTRRELLSNSSE